MSITLTCRFHSSSNYRNELSKGQSATYINKVLFIYFYPTLYYSREDSLPYGYNSKGLKVINKEPDPIDLHLRIEISMMERTNIAVKVRKHVNLGSEWNSLVLWKSFPKIWVKGDLNLALPSRGTTILDKCTGTN